MPNTATIFSLNGFELNRDMLISSNIPKALKILKENAGEQNWSKLRKTFIRFLDIKREIQNLKTFNYLQRLLFREFYTLLEKIDYNKESQMGVESIISHARNVLATLRSEPYRKDFMCYISDSYNTSHVSGNKKYPNLK